MDRLVAFCAVAVLTLIVEQPASSAQPAMEIISAEGDRLTIAARSTVIARGLGDILEADLRREDLSKHRRLEPSLIVEGAIQIGDQKIDAELRWKDARDGRVLKERAYAGEAGRERKIAHELAREIALHLTGEKSLAMTKIVAVKDGDLWSMDPTGGELTRLTSNRKLISRPSWSRDGRTLLYTSTARRTPELYSMSTYGGRPRLLSHQPGLNADARYSPDGKRISLTLTRDGNSEIYLLEDGRYRRLTDEWAMDSSAVWSPEGDRIAFISSRDGHAEIYVVSARGGAPIRITRLGKRCSALDWSPKGDRIVFSARDEKNVSDIYTVDPATGSIARLTREQGSNFDPSFSPDGRHVVFVSTRASATGITDLWIMDAGGSDATRITRGGGFSSPSWSPFIDDAIEAGRDGPYLSAR